jgi:quinol monooxygenase YgiN
MATRAGRPKQLVLFVDFYIRPDRIDEWKAAHRPVWTACSQEPECILFDVCLDPERAGHFRLIEVWNRDRHWFESVQIKKPYYDDLWAKTEHLYSQMRELQYFERLGEGFSYQEEYLAAEHSSS